MFPLRRNFTNNGNESFNNIGNKFSDFTMLEKLGEGNFGIVYKMKSNINNCIYIVKELKKSSLNETEKINLKREIQIQSKLCYPNFVNLLTHFYDGNRGRYYLVFDYFEGISLEEYAKRNNNINERIIIYILKQLLYSLQYLHSYNIIHRDIKPDNILINNNFNVKIIDFGISALIDISFLFEDDEDLRSKFTQVGRRDYVCPEIINNKKYDNTCDIFSLGYTMYYLMNHQLPSEVVNINNKKERRNLVPIINNNYNRDLVLLIQSMFSDNPNDRPTTIKAINILQSIENNINNMNNINNNNIQINAQNNNNIANNIPINNNKLISSLKCILECIHGIDNIHFINNIIKNSLMNYKNIFPLFFADMMDIINNKNNNKINKDMYNNYIRNFIKELWKRKEEIKGMRPILLYYDILSIFTREFSSLTKWTNKISTINYSNPIDLPQNLISLFYKNINIFKKEFNSPLVDIFYFIITVYHRCQNCNCIINAFSQISSFLQLENKNDNNITNLISNYFVKKTSNKSIVCNNCGNHGLCIEEKGFFNTPDYLVIDFVDEGQVEFEQNIDLNLFIKTNSNPKKYELYAIINKVKDNNNESQYICSIKENGEWMLYSGDNKENKGRNYLIPGIPSCSIYKGIK